VADVKTAVQFRQRTGNPSRPRRQQRFPLRADKSRRPCTVRRSPCSKNRTRSRQETVFDLFSC
jgi:hypothetical protein